MSEVRSVVNIPWLIQCEFILKTQILKLLCLFKKKKKFSQNILVWASYVYHGRYFTHKLNIFISPDEVGTVRNNWFKKFVCYLSCHQLTQANIFHILSLISRQVLTSRISVRSITELQSLWHCDIFCLELIKETAVAAPPPFYVAISIRRDPGRKISLH